MIDLYTWHTPNGRKAPILLAELGWPYELHLVDLSKKEQKTPEYLAINPNGKIPALIDRDGQGGTRVTVFESGAILVYLADKAGRFLPSEPRARAEVLSWVFWSIGGPGPFFGQLLAFGREDPRDQHAFEKFLAEGKRLAGVLESRLRDREWIAGEYSIADVVSYPWFAAARDAERRVLEGCDAVQRWLDRMARRDAVKEGMQLRR